VDTVRDFEDILDQFAKHGVRYLIIGGLAFIFHAKPRFTKDMDLWIGPEKENLNRVNEALAEFGSPFLLDPSKPEEILQLGMAPNRIDLLISVPGVDFNASWEKKIRAATERRRLISSISIRSFKLKALSMTRGTGKMSGCCARSRNFWSSPENKRISNFSGESK
jgi:hypothetical protein